MKWFKHKTCSHDDPDIQDAWDEFGEFGYVGFFVILEIYGEEYSHRNADNFITVSRTFLRRKLRKSSTKVEQLLNFYLECGRILSKNDGDKIILKVPNFMELASNWTKRSPTEAPTAKEEEVEEEVEVIPPYTPPVRTDRFSQQEIELDKEAKRIIAMMNELTGKHFPDIGGHMDTIKNRLRENYLFDQFEAVVKQKMSDPDFKENRTWLKPSTLFGKRFGEYLAEIDDKPKEPAPPKKKKPTFTPEQIAEYERYDAMGFVGHETEWQDLVDYLHSTMNATSYNSWIEPIRLLHMNDDMLCIASRLPEWIREHYTDTIKDALKEVTGRDYEVKIIVNVEV